MDLAFQLLSYQQLPANLHLLTSMDNSFYGAAGTMLLRISHLYAVGEDPVLGQPVTVALDQILAFVTVTGCTEMSVTANQKVSRRVLVVKF